jgi:hypothetical protein
MRRLSRNSDKQNTKTNSMLRVSSGRMRHQLDQTILKIEEDNDKVDNSRIKRSISILFHNINRVILVKDHPQERMIWGCRSGNSPDKHLHH